MGARSGGSGRVCIFDAVMFSFHQTERKQLVGMAKCSLPGIQRIYD